MFFSKSTGWCSTPTLLLICSSFSRKKCEKIGYPGCSWMLITICTSKQHKDVTSPSVHRNCWAARAGTAVAVRVAYCTACCIATGMVSPQICFLGDLWRKCLPLFFHPVFGENGDTLKNEDPLIINPIYTLIIPMILFCWVFIGGIYWNWLSCCYPCLSLAESVTRLNQPILEATTKAI